MMHGTNPFPIQTPRLPLTSLIDKVIQGDCTLELATIPDDSVHLIASDIPYGISADKWDVLHDNTNSALLGSSPAQKVAGSVFRSRGKPINGWSEADRAIPKQYQEWCQTWAHEWFRVLKPGASAFVFAGRRFAHRCVCALEDAGFSLKDVIAWERPRAAHRAQRVSKVFERRGDLESQQRWEGWRVGNLRPSFEPILWFVKPYKIGTTIADNMIAHGVGAFNETAYSRYSDRTNNILRIGPSVNEGGLHPTQKPVMLMQAIIELSTSPNQIVLDPFAGSCTTAVAASILNRRYIAIEIDSEYAQLGRDRLAEKRLV